MSYLTKLKQLLLEILFPPHCLNCSRYLVGEEKENGICGVCLSTIQIHNTLFCPVCRARLPENKKICHKTSKYLLGAASDYNDALRKLIHQFKYKTWQRILNPLGLILKKYLENLNLNSQLNNFIIIPIPLHPSREKERGFNQAELIGKIIAEYFNLPLEKNILIRNKNTKIQAELKDWNQRETNVANSFKSIKPEMIAGKNFILVDDVYTSGATINEAVKILKESGAKKIIALVLAKTR